MIIDKVSRVHAHTRTRTRTHASTHSIYTRTHAVGRGYFAPVGYVERYCCCVVVSVIEREVSPTERAQNCTPTKFQWTESQVKIPSMRGIQGAHMFIRKDNYIINTDKIEYFIEHDGEWIMVLPDLRLEVSTETVEKITNSRIRGGRNGKTAEKIQHKSNSK